MGGKIPGTGKQETIIMEEAVGGGMGILIAVLIMVVLGGIAGWIAEKIMKSDHGLLMNIILGIIGALVGNWLASAIFGTTDMSAKLA